MSAELQRTEDWFADRCGHVTASRFCDVLAVSKTNGKPLKAREDYLMRLVTERLTGKPTESISSQALQWGTESEPFARAEYEAQSGNIVTEVGFTRHPSIAWVGASADGLVGQTGGIEIKCPHNSTVHLRTWRDGMPEEHAPQVYGVMWVLGLEWMDFCSYDARMPPELRLYVQRVNRDEAYIANLERKIVEFLGELEAELQLFEDKRKAA